MDVSRYVDDIKVWEKAEQFLRDNGYMLWQTQYGWDTPEGYIARFMKGDNRIEIITHSEEVADAIIKSSL